MAKKHKKKEEAAKSKFEKFLPGEASWSGRNGKSRQDRMPIEQRDRVQDALHRVDWARKHHPKDSADWQGYRG